MRAKSGVFQTFDVVLHVYTMKPFSYNSYNMMMSDDDET